MAVEPRLFAIVIDDWEQLDMEGLLSDQDGLRTLFHRRHLQLFLKLQDFEIVPKKQAEFDTACERFAAFLDKLPMLEHIDITLRMPCVSLKRLQKILDSQSWLTFARIVSLNASKSPCKFRRICTTLRVGTPCSNSHFDTRVWTRLLAVFEDLQGAPPHEGPALQKFHPLHELAMTTRIRQETTLKQLPLSNLAISLNAEKHRTTLPLFVSYATAWLPVLTNLSLYAGIAIFETDVDIECHLPVLKRFTIISTASSACQPFFKNVRTPRLAVLEWECHVGENDSNLQSMVGESGSLKAFLAQCPELKKLHLTLWCDLRVWHTLGTRLLGLRSWLLSRKASLTIRYTSVTSRELSQEITDSLELWISLQPAWLCTTRIRLELNQLRLIKEGERFEKVECPLLQTLYLTVLNKSNDLQALACLLQSFDTPNVHTLEMKFESIDVQSYLKLLYDYLPGLPKLETCIIGSSEEGVDRSTTASEITEAFRSHGVHVQWFSTSSQKDWSGARRACRRSESHT